MNKLPVILLAVFLAVGCGRKAAPVPKATLNIPPPEWVELFIEEGGVRIVNRSSTYGLLVERAESEVGDLNFPSFRRIARIQPEETFIDNTTEQSIRYLFRFSSIHYRYDAYSQPITRTVSYRGAINIESLTFEIKGNRICLDMALSKSVTKTQVYINGQPTAPGADGCFSLPLTTQLLLVVVPYSESGTPGKAYSETITRDPARSLLPPQNMRIVRSGGNITLSWDSSAETQEYQITTNGRTVSVNATIFNWKAEADQCVDFAVRSVYSGKLSEPLHIRSCP